MSATDSTTLSIPSPTWDALAAARGRLYFSTLDGSIVCLQAAQP